MENCISAETSTGNKTVTQIKKKKTKKIKKNLYAYRHISTSYFVKQMKFRDCNLNIIQRKQSFYTNIILFLNNISSKFYIQNYDKIILNIYLYIYIIQASFIDITAEYLTRMDTK